MFTSGQQPASSQSIVSADHQVSFFQRFIKDSGFILTEFPIALVVFVISVTGFSLALGLVPLAIIGFPLGFAVAHCLRGLAARERQRLAWWGMNLAPAQYETTSEAGWRRYLQPFKDPQSRRDILHSILYMPISLMTWVFAIVLWSLPIALLLGVPAIAMLSPGGVPITFNFLFYSTDSPWIGASIAAVIGLVILVVLPFPIRWLATFQAQASAAILNQPAGA